LLVTYLPLQKVVKISRQLFELGLSSWAVLAENFWGTDPWNLSTDERQKVQLRKKLKENLAKLGGWEKTGGRAHPSQPRTAPAYPAYKDKKHNLFGGGYYNYY